MTLFAFERRWILAIFAAILPSGAVEQLPVGAADLPMGRFVDEVMLLAPTRAKLGIRLGAWLIVVAPPFVLGRLRTYMWLRPEERTALLVRMSESRHYLVREVPTLFKMLAALGYGGSPSVQRQLGIEIADSSAPDWIRGPS